MTRNVILFSYPCLKYMCCKIHTLSHDHKLVLFGQQFSLDEC